MNEQNKKAEMRTMPEGWVSPRGEAEVRVVGREVVSVARDAGRFNNGVVSTMKPEGGIPIDFPGHDTFRSQPRTFSDTTAPKERPTEHEADEV